MKDFEIEKKKLVDTIEKIKQIIAQETEEIDELYSVRYLSKDEIIRRVASQELHVRNMKKSKDIPYFARIDFKTDENGLEVFYIGKHGIFENDNMIVTDWRAPISNVYYDSNIGECQYTAPEGVIDGELLLKRQFQIENGNLLNYFDVDLVTNDQLLQEYLNENNDNRLKTIVATIQKEQNDVIRKKMANNLIVQGVAGSGKTTVALHRIAYLVYNHRDLFNQNQFMVIGPNKVFIKYIESVLPDLDVSNVSQFTYEDFANLYIGEDIKVSDSNAKMVKKIANKANNDIEKFKCSLNYKNMLDSYLNEYIDHFISSDLTYGSFTILTKKQILKAFDYGKNIDSLKARIEWTIVRLSNEIKNHSEDILIAFQRYYREKFENAKTIFEKENIKKETAKGREEIKKGCVNILRKYFSKVDISPVRMYKNFIRSIEKYDLCNYNDIQLLKKTTLDNLKDGIFDYEDLAPIMYIKQRFNPVKSFVETRHVVIDEAQDLGLFNFYVLKKCLPNATFSIFGDLAQSIYDYRSIANWQELNDNIFNDNVELVEFKKSYRTTNEIMKVADEVSDSIGLGKSDLVIRHGNPVQITHVIDDNKMPQYIANKINEYIDKGYKTIAVISKTNLMSRYINDDLNDLGLHIPNIELNSDVSDDGCQICTISNALAKGLEFDAIIINNASDNVYSIDKSFDMKLLYVAITRALHEVDIVYSGELTLPLANLLESNNGAVLSKTI